MTHQLQNPTRLPRSSAQRQGGKPRASRARLESVRAAWGALLNLRQSWALHLDVLSHSHHHGRRLGGKSFRALAALSVSSVVHGVPQTRAIRWRTPRALSLRSNPALGPRAVRAEASPPASLSLLISAPFLGLLDACSSRVVGSTSLSRFVGSLPEQLSLGAAVRGTSSFLA